MKTKRICALMLVLTLTLAAFAGCDRPQSSAEASSVVSQTPAEAADLAEFTDPAVLNTAYTRAKCLALPAAAADPFFPNTSDRLCTEFVQANYADYGVTIVETKFLFGSSSDGAIYGLDGNIQLDTARVTFTLETAPGGITAQNGEYSLVLQTVCRTDNADTTYTLQGFVTSQTKHITSSSQLLRFLKSDPANSALEIVGPEAADGVKMYNVNKYTDGGVASVMLLGGMLAFTEYDYNTRLAGEETYPAFTLRIVDPANDKNILIHEIEDGDRVVSASLTLTEKGNLGLRTIYTDEKGNGVEEWKFFNSQGQSVEDEITDEDGKNKKVWLSDDVYVYASSSWKLRISRNGKTSALDNSDATSKYNECNSVPLFALDSTRFIYRIELYESQGGTYIYDIETGKSTELAFVEGEVLTLRDFRNGMAILSGSEYDGSTTSKTYVADLTGTSPTAWELCSGETCSVTAAKFNSDCGRLAIIHCDYNEGNSTNPVLEIYDTQTHALLKRYAPYSAFKASDKIGVPQLVAHELTLVDDSHVAVFTGQISCLDRYVFSVEIP